MKYVVIIAAAIIGIAAPAVAAERSLRAVVQYECDQLDAKRDGVLCKVTNYPGYPKLLIRIYRAPGDGDEARRRTAYLVERTMHNFMAMGGTFAEWRTSKDGQMYSRACGRFAGQTRYVCHDWAPVTAGPIDAHWEALER